MDERRYYGLDALRGGMMMLGIVLHAGGFYVAAPPPSLPVPTDRNTSYVFDLLFVFGYIFHFYRDFLQSSRATCRGAPRWRWSCFRSPCT